MIYIWLLGTLLNSGFYIVFKHHSYEKRKSLNFTGERVKLHSEKLNTNKACELFNLGEICGEREKGSNWV